MYDDFDDNFELLMRFIKWLSKRSEDFEDLLIAPLDNSLCVLAVAEFLEEYERGDA